MKLKNITKEIRKFRDKGKEIYLEPGKSIEVVKPVFASNSFKIIGVKDKMTSSLVGKEELKKEKNTDDSSE